MNTFLSINRWAYSPYGTFGTLRIYRDAGDPAFECFSLEPLWLPAEQVSCLPTGYYNLNFARTHDDSSYNTYEVEGAENRVIFSPADILPELHNNIGIGNMLTMKHLKWGLGGARESMKRLLRELKGGDDIQLSITANQYRYEPEQFKLDSLFPEEEPVPEAATSGGWSPEVESVHG